jgi:hypothetical protein
MIRSVESNSSEQTVKQPEGHPQLSDKQGGNQSMKQHGTGIGGAVFTVYKT